MCYTCVRECPAKAIRIADGQAEVIPERCIACGNCVKVCKQNAKRVLYTLDEVEELLESPHRVAACIAPSFPANFSEWDGEKISGILHEVGFELVCQVAFGADLVAKRYRELFETRNGCRYISTTCPAVVGYVERYHPELVSSLAPIVSPMVAMARALRRYYGPDLKIVFIGPCIGKKLEARTSTMPTEVDAAITFGGIFHLIHKYGINPETVEPRAFDPPHPGPGLLFPIGRGLLQAADIHEDLLSCRVVSTEGRSNFTEALREFEEGNLDTKLLDVLACQGCFMGPGVTTRAPLFRRRDRISRFASGEMQKLNLEQWQKDMELMADLDLSRSFVKNDQRIRTPNEGELAKIMERLGKLSPADQLDCGACGYDTCREHAIAIYKGLAESEMCLPSTIVKLRTVVNELANSNQQLASMQEALMHTEKLASMGQLAAGIAHELNNPLGVVLMYAHLLLEDCEDQSKMKGDLELIAQQADRCKKIVGGLLHFARQNKVLRQVVEAKALIDRSLKSVSIPENVKVEIKRIVPGDSLEVDPDQMVQVLTNLYTNAFSAMPEGGLLEIEAKERSDRFVISVRDTGTGIPEDIRKKIFEPFFTTKQIGKGTGLGLSVVYGIIKMHRGDIRVESNADPAKGPTGTTFVIDLPRE